MTNQPSEREWKALRALNDCVSNTERLNVLAVHFERAIDAAIKEARKEGYNAGMLDAKEILELRPILGEMAEKDTRIKELETALRKVLAQSWEDHVQRIAEEALNGGAGDE